MSIGFPKVISKLNLKTRIALGASTLVFAITLILTAITLVYVKNDLRQEISAKHDAALTKTVMDLDSSFMSRKDTLSKLALQINSLPVKTSDAIQTYLESRYDLNVLFDNVLIVDQRGFLVGNLKVPTARGTINVSERAYFNNTLDHKKGVISSPVKSPVTDKPMVSITEPVFDNNGQVSFILAGTIELYNDNFLGTLGRTKVGNTGYYFVLSQDGWFVSHPAHDRIMKNVHEDKIQSNVINIALTKFSGTIETFNSKKLQALYSFHHMSTTGWTVVSVYPVDEAFAAVDNIQIRGIFLAVFLSLGIAPLAWWVTKKQVDPLNTLGNQIKEFEESKHFTYDPSLYPTDEIGALASAFNNLISTRLTAELELKRSAADLEGATNSSLDGFFILHAVRNNDGNIVDFRFKFVNEQALAIFQKQDSVEVLGKLFSELFPEATERHFIKTYSLVVESRKPIQEEFSIDDGPNGIRWLTHQAVPLEDGLAVTARDITQTKIEETSIRENRAFLQSLIDNLPVGVYVKEVGPDKVTKLIKWNPIGEFITGFSEAEILGSSNADLFPPNVAKMHNDYEIAIIERKEPAHVPELKFKRKDGEFRTLRITSLPILNEDGNVRYIISIFEDITTQVAQQRELEERRAAIVASEKRVKLIADNAPGLIAYIDRDCRYQYHNAMFKQIPIFDTENMLGKHVEDIFGPSIFGLVRDEIAKVLNGERVKFTRLIKDHGLNKYLQFEYVPDIGENGEVVGFYSMIIDITEFKEVENKLRMSARFDALTKLPNRVQYDEAIVKAIGRSERSGSPMAIMFLDIDNFKSINDTLGHRAGDEVLCKFAERLSGCTRKTDTVARLAGDEFVIILEGLQQPDYSVAVAEKIIAEMKEPMEVEGKLLQVTTSVGFVVREAGEIDPQQLLHKADLALYKTKQAGRNGYSKYSEDLR